MTSRDDLSPAIQDAYRVCEERLQVLRTPFLGAARELDDPHRRHAFYAAYLSLRVRGPAVLPRPVGQARSLAASKEALRAWRDAARVCNNGQPDPTDPEQIALADTMARFAIPMVPWIRLESGLIAVAEGRPVADLDEFLARAGQLGAAQAWVFLRILVARPGARRYRVPSDIDVEKLSHDPGVFAYVVRRMMDVFSELDWWDEPRTSLPEDILARHGLGVDALRGMRGLARAPREFYELMNDMAHVGWRYYQNGVARLAQAAASLPREAVARVDRNLEGYKSALMAMERARFAPVSIGALAGERKGRMPDPGAGPEPPEMHASSSAGSSPNTPRH